LPAQSPAGRENLAIRKTRPYRSYKMIIQLKERENVKNSC